MREKYITWLLARVLAASLLIWISGCKKDNVDPAPTIQGDWIVSAYRIDPAIDLLGTGQKITDLMIYYRALLGDSAVSCMTQIKVSFKDDGSVSSVAGQPCALASPFRDSASWKYSDSKVTITNKNGSSKPYAATFTASSVQLAKTEKDDYNNDGKPETVTFILELTRP